MDRKLNRGFPWRASPKREALLWLGTLHRGNGRSQIAMLIKRTWSTGKLEYVLKIDDTMGSAMFDTSRPCETYSTDAEAAALPPMLLNQQWELAGKSPRLRIEYLPRSSGLSPPGVQTDPVIVKARFREPAKVPRKTDRLEGAAVQTPSGPAKASLVSCPPSWHNCFRG
jgi:hypothetical protein